MARKKKGAADTNGKEGEEVSVAEASGDDDDGDLDENELDVDADAKVIKELEAIDDEYLAVEKELHEELLQVKQKYQARLDGILEKRLGILSSLPSNEELSELPPEIAETTKSNGSPNLPGFWGQVLINSEEFGDHIEDHDRPVLEYLSDVRAEWIDSTRKSGFNLVFKFAENPYFSHRELKKTIHTEPRKFEAENFDVLRSVCEPAEIEWCPGKNVTVTAKVDKKKKSSNKSGRGNSEKSKPQPSFFRQVFRNLKPDVPLPEIYEGCDDSDDDESESEIRSELLSEDYDLGVALRDNIIPHAVRWYTKEALSDDESDSDDEDEKDNDKEDQKILDAPWNMSVGGKAKGKGGKGKR